MSTASAITGLPIPLSAVQLIVAFASVNLTGSIRNVLNPFESIFVEYL